MLSPPPSWSLQGHVTVLGAQAPGQGCLLSISLTGWLGAFVQLGRAACGRGLCMGLTWEGEGLTELRLLVTPQRGKWKAQELPRVPGLEKGLGTRQGCGAVMQFSYVECPPCQPHGPG